MRQRFSPTAFTRLRAALAVLLLLVLGFASPLLASERDMDLLQTLRSLPNLSAQLEAQYPSHGMGITGLKDPRIEKLAREVKTPFRLDYFQAGAKLPVYFVIDPSRAEGMLWWKRAARIAIGVEEWKKVEDKTGDFSPAASGFLEALPKAKG